MSALIRRLNVLRSQTNLQTFSLTGNLAPRLLSNSNVLGPQRNEQTFPLNGITISRFLSSAKEPGKQDAANDEKPGIDKSIFDKLVRSNKVVVFMKGNPKAPRCGFSNAVVQIFRMHGVEYDAHDVLENDEIREGIKKYTDWPTIPQVFINGEFVGGCDIMLEMHQSGELIEQLNKVGIVSHLLRLEREKEAKAQKDQNKSNNQNN